MPRKPLRVLTWHVHGNYLYYLTQVPHDFFLVTKPDRSGEYSGRGGTLPWGANVFEAPVESLAEMKFDCILYQSKRAYEDRLRLLSAEQRRLPRIYIEHDPPQESPTDTRHIVQDPDALLVHVTAFNALMWDNGETPTTVVEHGVVLPKPARYDGTLPCGIVVVNNLRGRGRRLGADVFEEARRHVPLDLVGMDALSFGGLGEVDNVALAGFIARYRFFFNPIRYTSLGLAIIEAMMVGLPIIGLATTELVTVVRNGESGYLDTRLDRLIIVMKALIQDSGEAKRLGEGARRYAEQRFNIDRFVADWLSVFKNMCS